MAGRPTLLVIRGKEFTVTSYNKLAPVALKELNLTESFIERAGKSTSPGPEAAQSFMASLNPTDLGLRGSAEDAVLRHFEVKLLTEGAGTQIFSTTFVQWAAREAMRRAQPITMLARFAPRQRMAPMNELLKRNPLDATDGPRGFAGGCRYGCVLYMDQSGATDRRGPSALLSLV